MTVLSMSGRGFGAVAAMLLLGCSAADGSPSGEHEDHNNDAGNGVDGGGDGSGTDGGGDGSGTDSGGDGPGTDGGGDGAGTDDGTPPPRTVPVLGNGAHSMDAVRVTELASGADGLGTPRDLAFHPDNVGELWVINRRGPSMAIITSVATVNQAVSMRSGAFNGGLHFMAQPSALAFGQTGRLATAHEEDQVTPGTNDNTGRFMGPTLWNSDRNAFDAGHATHMDMLHNTPNGAGIAWETGNAYWLFDGYHRSLTRYDFRQDHGPGGTDHRDGKITRYVEGQVGYVPDVPSHLAMDREAGLLYVADTGNGRIAVLDIDSGERAGSLPSSENMDGLYAMDMSKMKGEDFWTFADGLTKPSGILLRDDLVFVSDNETSQILAFDLDGELIDWLNTGLPEGSLMGIAFGGEGHLYYVDAVGSRLFKVAPL